jgi:hypothetical protein
MDTSGLGNMVFGYFSVMVSREIATRIGDVFQLITDRRLDFPDDRDQILLGRSIAESGQNVTAQLVESLIPPSFSSSR